MVLCTEPQTLLLKSPLRSALLTQTRRERQDGDTGSGSKVGGTEKDRRGSGSRPRGEPKNGVKSTAPTIPFPEDSQGTGLTSSTQRRNRMKGEQKGQGKKGRRTRGGH